MTFGTVAFRVVRDDPRPTDELPAGVALRAVDVRSGGGPLARIAAERLARLVDLARQLSGEFETDRVLALVVAQAAALLPVDRVALLLLDQDTGDLVASHQRNRLGEAPVQVPRSIARRAIEERTPMITENAARDARFGGASVQTSQVRAALCVPLMADQDRALGVLYADSLTASGPFGEPDAALCMALGGLAAVSIAKAHYAAAARREELIRVNFERFFAPDVAARIAASPSGIRPGGERRAVTVLYSDVRGFTGLAESLAPETVAAHLSEYFAAMVELVFQHGGTLDKFSGDGLLAVWGAPLAAPDDADRALAAARAMQLECAALNAHWTGAGRPPLAIGIGLHHGEAFTGMIGSPRRLDYTVIGDVVNVAARLCEAARAAEIVVSDALWRRLSAIPATGDPEDLRVRGREEAVRIHRIPGAR
ncbi:MAG TPA: adenylate/guanylate cyclase domain-containing protein [Gemmatimonadales bacterium]|nr:adenylate/guanylate cyclase domain-containing protein [Gemmatimonadales bacterium]